MTKPIFTPSSVKDYETCKKLYHWRWEELLELPGTIEAQPTLGTLGHRMQAAFELGEDPEAALNLEIKKLKRGPGYTTAQFQLLSQLSDEARLIFRGGSLRDSKGKSADFPGYAAYRTALQIGNETLATLDVERTLYVDLGPIIAAPTLDLVLETDGGDLWVAEWKFTERDDKGWETRWLLDGQTTMQVLAAETHYRRPVKGLLLLPLVYGRKRAPDNQESSSVVGRPIIRALRPDPRWIPKNSPALRANYLGRLEDLAYDYLGRLESNRWPTSGMDTRACDRCGFRGICAGKDSPKRLQPLLADAHQRKLALLRKRR